MKTDCKWQISDASTKSTVLCPLFPIYVVCPWRDPMVLPLRTLSFTAIQKSNNF